MAEPGFTPEFRQQIEAYQAAQAAQGQQPESEVPLNPVDPDLFENCRAAARLALDKGLPANVRVEFDEPLEGWRLDITERAEPVPVIVEGDMGVYEHDQTFDGVETSVLPRPGTQELVLKRDGGLYKLRHTAYDWQSTELDDERVVPAAQVLEGSHPLTQDHFDWPGIVSIDRGLNMRRPGDALFEFMVRRGLIQ